MTEIERKALALLQDCGFHGGYIDRKWNENYEALCHAIEQHEAFRQEVSDAVGRAIDDCGHDGMRKAHISSRLDRFIITKPVDPLVEALCEMDPDTCPNEADAENLRQALAARGLKIVEVE